MYICVDIASRAVLDQTCLIFSEEGEWRGIEWWRYSLGWGHIKIIYKNPTYCTKPQLTGTEQSLKRPSKTPKDYTKT